MDIWMIFLGVLAGLIAAPFVIIIFLLACITAILCGYGLILGCVVLAVRIKLALTKPN